VKQRRYRGYKAGGGYRSLHFSKIAERDGLRCGICGEAVDMMLKVPDPMAPTLDHIVPLARGGSHSESNAQLAHFICNSTKGDGTSCRSGQLALV